MPGILSPHLPQVLGALAYLGEMPELDGTLGKLRRS